MCQVLEWHQRLERLSSKGVKHWVVLQSIGDKVPSEGEGAWNKHSTGLHFQTFAIFWICKGQELSLDLQKAEFSRLRKKKISRVPIKNPSGPILKNGNRPEMDWILLSLLPSSRPDWIYLPFMLSDERKEESSLDGRYYLEPLLVKHNDQHKMLLKIRRSRNV